MPASAGSSGYQVMGTGCQRPPVARTREPGRPCRACNARDTYRCQGVRHGATSIRSSPTPSRDYGSKVVAVEPGGVEFIPLAERHGTPLAAALDLDLAEHGVRDDRASASSARSSFGLSFWQSVAAIVLGTALGSATHGVLSTWGPRHGLPQMVLSRSAFGFFGNILPAGLNSARRRHRLVRGQQRQRRARAARAVQRACSTTLCLVIVVAAQLLHRLLRAQPGARLRALRRSRC